MKQKILERAKNHALHYNDTLLKNDDIRVKSPILFIMLGNKAEESIDVIKTAMNQNAMNGEGIVYFNIGLTSAVEKENVVSLSLPFHCEEEKTYRSILTRKLLEDQTLLMALNQKVHKLKQSILNKSKMFTNWEQISVVVITAANDPLSVLLPDITVLVQNKLQEDFKQVFTDLFVCVDEEEQNTALNQARTMSLFKELDTYQSPDYYYERSVEVLDETIKVTLTHKHQLFDIVYILTDKQENGQKIERAKEQHYETIAAVSFLKNRYQKQIEMEEAKEQYNNALFMNNIRFKAQNRYASAKLAKVKKPDIGIYMAVAYHLYNTYKDSLKYEGTDEMATLFDALGLSDTKLNQFVYTALPSSEMLKNIYSLMSHQRSFKELKNLSFKEAEALLYGKACEEFFEVNFKVAAGNILKTEAMWVKLKEQIIKGVLDNPTYGPYAFYELFKEENMMKIGNIREQILFSQRQLEEQIKEKQEQLVGQRIGTKFSILDKKYLKDVKDYLVEEIYELKYKSLKEELKVKQIDYIKVLLEGLYEEIKDQIKKLDQVGGLLKELMEEANKFEEEYLVQNVKEYYEKVVAEKIEQMKKARGEDFFHDEKFMGDMTQLLSQGPEYFFERLLNIEEKYILIDEKLFQTSFEDELLARANVAVNYEDTEIVAKSELYNMLYESLEENSRVCVYLDTVELGHRYEEKYFFGDRESEFMNYTYQRDQSSRNYKLAYINDKKKSSMEKLQLMGGFKLSDLVLAKAAERYYEVYLKEGYKFHSDLNEEKRDVNGE